MPLKAPPPEHLCKEDNDRFVLGTFCHSVLSLVCAVNSKGPMTGQLWNSCSSDNSCFLTSLPAISVHTHWACSRQSRSGARRRFCTSGSKDRRMGHPSAWAGGLPGRHLWPHPLWGCSVGSEQGRGTWVWMCSWILSWTPSDTAGELSQCHLAPSLISIWGVTKRHFDMIVYDSHTDLWPRLQGNISIRVPYLSNSSCHTWQEDFQFGIGTTAGSSCLAQTVQTVPVCAKCYRRSHGDGGERQCHAFEEAPHLQNIR